MIENYLWQYLVVFAQEKTITKTAQKLNVTPASVSRGLKKLEELLGEELFVHSPQRLVLNELGDFTVQKAKELLKQEEVTVKQIKNYATSTAQIKIASTLKGARLLADDLFGISTQAISEEEVGERLLNYENNLIFTTKEVTDSRIKTTYLGSEALAIMITPQSELFKQDEVSFSDLAGQSFIVAQNIGTWQRVLDKYTKDVIYIPQEKGALVEITKNSELGAFCTNITYVLDKTRRSKQRKVIFLSDVTAKLPIYGVYRPNDEEKIKSYLQKMTRKLAELKK